MGALLGLCVFIHPARFVSFSLPLCLFFPSLAYRRKCGWPAGERERDRNGEKSDRSKGLRGRGSQNQDRGSDNTTRHEWQRGAENKREKKIKR